MRLEPDDAPDDHPRLRPIEAIPVSHEGRRGLLLRDPFHYAESPVFVPVEMAALLRLFDGRHSLLDIQAAYARGTGRLLFREQVLEIVRSLDQQFLLESPGFAARRAGVEAAFLRAPVRPPFLAGRGYPDDPEALRRFLGECQAAAGAGGPSPDGGRLVGLIVPHIDYARGGAGYARGYREAAGGDGVDRWVILGTAHAAMDRPYAVTRKPFETPLGRVETDGAFLDRLLAGAGEACLEAERAHRTEHSIELQAVFLRHLVPPERPVRIVPILCGGLEAGGPRGGSPADSAEVAGFLAALGETLREAGGRTVVVASADLAHVGPQFGDSEPVGPGQLQELEASDRALLCRVEAVDAEGFFRAVARDGDRNRICGLPPIYAALRLLRGARGRLLDYRQWADPQGTVTFAAAGLYAGAGGEPGGDGTGSVRGGVA